MLCASVVLYYQCLEFLYLAITYTLHCLQPVIRPAQHMEWPLSKPPEAAFVRPLQCPLRAVAAHNRLPGGCGSRTLYGGSYAILCVLLACVLSLFCQN